MNTTAKGDLLENKVYELLCEAVDSNKYGLFTKLHKHKTYIVPSTQRKIIIDVSIDVYNSKDDMDNDLPTYSLIFECKNYGKKIDGGIYDAFHSKISQLTGCKGYLVTNKGFSDTVVNTARTHGIGLYLISDNWDKLNLVLRRSINTKDNSRNYIRIIDNGQELSLVEMLLYNKVPVKSQYIFKAPHIKMNT